MPWFKIDDTFAMHEKVMAAGNSAIGLWARSGAWSMQQLTDGFVPNHVLRALGTPKERRTLVEVSLWTEVEGGITFRNWEERQPSKASIEAQRRADAERQVLSRDPELRDEVRRRDGDYCRYCGRQVRFNDRRGAGGGTYDHVVPTGGTTKENIVVCCRGCNARKGRRTPSEAGMPLLNVTKSDLSRGTRSTPGPDPTRPDPTPKDKEASPRKRPATRIPDGWKPTETHWERRQDGIDVANQAATFRAHAEANDRRCVNWNAAFTQWLLKSKPAGQQHKGRAAQWLDLAQELGDGTRQIEEGR